MLRIGDLVLYRERNRGIVKDVGLVIRLYPGKLSNMIRASIRFSNRGTIIDTFTCEIERSEALEIIPRKNEKEKILVEENDQDWRSDSSLD